MLRRLLEVLAPGPVFDLCEVGGNIYCALGDDGLWRANDGQRAEVEAEFLVPSSSGVLVLGFGEERTLTFVSLAGELSQGLKMNLSLWTQSFQDQYWPAGSPQGGLILLELANGRLQELRLPRGAVTAPESLCWWSRRTLWVEDMPPDGDDCYHEISVPGGEVRSTQPFASPPRLEAPQEKFDFYNRGPSVDHEVWVTGPRATMGAAARVLVAHGAPLTTLPGPAAGLEGKGNRAVVWVPQYDGMYFFWLDLRERKVRSTFKLPSSRYARARIAGPRLLVGDDQGRVLVFEEED